ncbi:hypothetical protein FRC11_011741 [Ceratobasidium sp. 423]|nr:hypothetical protein FRC11_011741 [Ceratobasidium sp. 423]
MFVGNSTSISLVVLYVRRSYFKAKCEAAVRMARQQRHEKELIRHALVGSSGTGPSMFARVRARAHTLFGHQPPVEPKPEAREDGLAEKAVLPEPEQQRTRNRVRGETIVGSLHETIASDDTHIDDAAGNHVGNGEKVGNGYGKAPTDDNDATSDANADVKTNGHHPEDADRRSGPGNANDHHHVNSFVPPTFTQTAPTPSPTLTLLPDVVPSPNGHGILVHSPNYPSPSPNAGHQTLPPSHIGEALTTPRKATLSPSSTRRTTLSPVFRPAFLHAPHITARGRRTTFAEQVHPLHPHGHVRERAPTVHYDAHAARRAAIRARNGTITSPMVPFANLAESDVNGSPVNGHSKLANEYGQGYVQHPLRRPRAQTGTGGFANPIGLVAQWGVDYISGVKTFVDAHEREVAHEGRERRGSVYQRTDSVGSHGAGGLAPPDDDVSLDEDDLEKMGGDEYNALVVLSWIVAGHYFVNHVIAFIILAPYSAKVPLVRDVIEAQNQSSGRTLNTTWQVADPTIGAQ